MWTYVEVIWFMSTVGWSSSVWIFGGVGKDSFSCEHTLATQTSFLHARSTRRTFPSVGGVQGHRLVYSLDAVMHCTPLEPPSDFTWTLYFTWTTLLVFLLPGLFGFDWTHIKWLSRWTLGWQAEKARAELACTFHLTCQCEIVQRGEWAWTWARRLPGFRALLCHWLWPGDVTSCLCFLNCNVGITVDPPLQNCEDWMR